MTDATVNLKQALLTKSPQFIELKPKWDKARILYKGEDAVHDAGTDLLPRLEQQSDGQYKSYTKRTRFLNAFKRTVKGLEGTVTRKEPQVNLDEIKDLIDNIDGNGTKIDAYCKKVLHESIKIGISGTLVDHTDVTDGDLTVAEKEAQNSRPVLAYYTSDNILYPHYNVVDGIKKLVLLTLLEKKYEKENEFETKEYQQVRVLRINDEGYYEQQIYVIKDEDVEVEDAITPLFHNEKLKVIPFFFHGEYEEPPLYDLVTNNIKHYQLKADHCHGLHYIGLPTPYRTGVDPNDKSLPTAIGPQTIWDIEYKDAKVGYLEFEGKGMDHIKDELDDIKEDMAFLGAAMLATDEMVNETATKATYRNASETSNLADIVIDDSGSITAALKFLSMWHKKKDESETEYNFNDDFDITKLTAQDILARVQAWQAGGFSKPSLFKQLKEGEVEMVGETFEEEEALITSGVEGDV